METLSVRCNHCGAPLTVGTDTRFVTCQFCHCQLEVKRTDSSIFTEEVAKLAKNTEKMAESLEVIKLQNEIERLDREWAAAQPLKPHQSRGRHGNPTGPPRSPQGAAFGLIFAIFFAVVCFSMAGLASSNGAPGLFALVPVGMGIMALFGGFKAIGASHKYQQQQSTYQEQRNRLAAKLDALNPPESGR